MGYNPQESLENTINTINTPFGPLGYTQLSLHISKFLNNTAIQYKKGHLRRRSKCAIHGWYWQPHMWYVSNPWLFNSGGSLILTSAITVQGWPHQTNRGCLIRSCQYSERSKDTVYSHCLCFPDFGNKWNRFQWYFLSSHGRKVNNHPPKKKNDDVNTCFSISSHLVKQSRSPRIRLFSVSFPGHGETFRHPPKFAQGTHWRCDGNGMKGIGPDFQRWYQSHNSKA